MKHPSRYLFLSAVLFVLTACQTPMQSGSQCVVEPGYLDTENTFSWRQGGLDVQDDTGYVSPLMRDALRQAVAGHLAGKGFTATEDTADVQVMLTLRTRRELVSFETGGSPCRDVDCWEQITPGAGTRMDIRTIGFLAADVFYGGKPIWRGWVETNLYPRDRDGAEDVIARAVPELFASFPP